MNKQQWIDKIVGEISNDANFISLCATFFQMDASTEEAEENYSERKEMLQQIIYDNDELLSTNHTAVDVENAVDAATAVVFDYLSISANWCYNNGEVEETFASP